MNAKILDLLVCPLCKGKLHWDANQKELICRVDRLAYPVRNDIPIMLAEEARSLSLEELES